MARVVRIKVDVSDPKVAKAYVYVPLTKNYWRIAHDTAVPRGKVFQAEDILPVEKFGNQPDLFSQALVGKGGS